jgi:hypothetical protein
MPGGAVTEPDVRGALLGAVPELAAPPDRVGEVKRRAARLRTARLTRAVVVGVIALVAVGGSLRLLAVGGSAPPAAGRSPSSEVSISAGPADSAEPSPAEPARTDSPTGEPSRPANSGPLVARDFCPPALALLHPVGVDEVPYHTGSPQVTHVTLCRYRHPEFDLSVGPGSLVAGPRRADPTAVSSALVPILQPASSANWNSEGCRYPWPQRDVVVDIAYAIDIHGKASAYLLDRVVCQNPWPDDPEIALREEVDRVLGPPY